LSRFVNVPWVDVNGKGGAARGRREGGRGKRKRLNHLCETNAKQVSLGRRGARGAWGEEEGG